MFNKITEFCFLFVLLFSFKVPVLYSSTICVFLALLVLSIYNYSNFWANIRSITLSKKFYTILILLIIIICSAIVCTTIYGVYDFSLTGTLVNQLFNLSAVVLIACVFYRRGRDIIRSLNLLLMTFSLQGIIMVLSLIFPSFKSIIEFTHSEETIIKSLIDYGGYRNLAFGGTQFFGYNAAVGIAFLFNSFVFAKTKKIIYIFSGIFIMTAIFLSGRTSIIALILGILYILLSIKIGKKDLRRLLWISPLIILVLLTMLPMLIAIVPEFILKWAFELFFNFYETGELTTRSSDTLMERMIFFPDLQIFLLGSGRYMNSDGSYFMRTDSGIMRPLLYFGFWGPLIFLIYHISILKAVVYGLGTRYKKSVKSFFALLLTVSVLFTVKGEFLGFLIMSQNIFFYIIFNGLLIKKNADKYNHSNSRG